MRSGIFEAVFNVYALITCLIRALFNLPRQEIDSIREEARTLLIVGGEGGSVSALSESLPTPPNQVGQ